MASSGLTQAQVDGLINEAEQYKESDQRRKELAELKNSAEALLYTSERAVNECADLVPAEVLAEVRIDVTALRDLMSNGGDAVSIREALQRLEISAYKIAESMYGGASNG